MKKKILATILAVIILMNCAVLMPKTQAATFPDISNTHWAYIYIEEMVECKIINGYTDGTFKPQNQVKTGEFIKMLCMAIWPNFEYARWEEHWASHYVYALDNLMLDKRKYNAERLERIITREEAAELICEFVMLININNDEYSRLDQDQKYIKNMKDESLITNEKSRIYIDNCIRFGLINGFEDGTFRPNDGLTRAQAAKLIYSAQYTFEG